MKGDQTFRVTTQSSTQCSNEVYIYKEVIPYFRKFIKECGSSLKPDWASRVYYADYKVFDELNTEKETILALKNVSPFGFRLGPRIDLDEPHLSMMVKQIATYHAVNYAMKIKKDPMFKKLAKGMVPLSYLTLSGEPFESYHILFVIGLERFFNLVLTSDKYDKDFVARVKKFKDQYADCPLSLMQSFLNVDEEIFSIITHGDYNRNNVLFQYDGEEGFNNPKDIKMIDFQETRYATPAIDLAFFMYMNLPTALRPKLWDSFLELYHETLINSLVEILKCGKDDERLLPYSFENFMKHFKKTFFYGIMIGIHFIPWMACSEEECSEMSHLFETAIKSPKLRQCAQVCGGADVDDRITSIAVHAFEKGFMDIFN